MNTLKQKLEHQARESYHEALKSAAQELSERLRAAEIFAELSGLYVEEEEPKKYEFHHTSITYTCDKDETLQQGLANTVSILAPIMRQHGAQDRSSVSQYGGMLRTSWHWHEPYFYINLSIYPHPYSQVCKQVQVGEQLVPVYKWECGGAPLPETLEPAVLADDSIPF